MTIARITQESFDILGGDWSAQERWILIGTTSTYTTGEYTGTYAAAFSGLHLGAYHRIDSAISQMRTGMMFRFTSASTPLFGVFFLASGDVSTLALHIYYNGSTNTWYAYAGATELGSFVLDVEDNQYRHLGVDFLSDASSGWCSIYIDGEAKLTYTGQTNQGSSDFDLLGFGPVNSTYDGWSALNIDDLYFDDTTGELSPSSPPLKRFYPIAPNGNGNYSQWHGDDGDQTNNYARVSMVGALSTMSSGGALESATSGHRDSWTLGDTTGILTDASSISAVIAEMWVQRRAVSGVQVRPFLRHGSTNSDGDLLTPAIGTGMLTHRFTTDPSSAAWTKTVIDALEMGIKFE